MTNVRQTSIDAFHSVSAEKKLEIEGRILALFNGDFDVRLTRQEIEDTTEKIPGGHIRIPTVCSAVNKMREKKLLVEDGTKLGTRSQTAQLILRLFNPAVDKENSRTDLALKLRHAQGTLILLQENCEYVQIKTGSEGTKYKKLLSFADGELYQQVKSATIFMLEMEISNLTRDLREAMGLMFIPGED